MLDPRDAHRPRTATPREIVDFWASREDECGLAVDWAEATELCWRCGYQTRLERCHIIPAALGGPETPDNLVLLCRRCHREAPNHENPRYMWRWLRATCVPFYDTYWTFRGMQEFETLFGRRPLSGLGTDEGHNSLGDEFSELLAAELRRVVIHFGEGRLNPSTIACVMAEVEQTVAHRRGITLLDSEAGFTGRRFLANMFGRSSTEVAVSTAPDPGEP